MAGVMAITRVFLYADDWNGLSETGRLKCSGCCRPPQSGREWRNGFVNRAAQTTVVGLLRAHLGSAIRPER